MGALIVWAKILPSIVVATHALRARPRARSTPLGADILLVGALGDVVVLVHFWSVRTDGSWLDMGVAISHFGLASALVLITSLLLGIVSWLRARGVARVHAE